MKESRTTKLLQELEAIPKNNSAYQAFLKKHKDKNNFSSLQDYLNYCISQDESLTISDIVFRSNLSANYVYLILNGKRKHPSKYILVALCIGTHMDLKSTRRALTLAGCSTLDPKNDADASIIICINNGCNSVMEVEEFLLESNVESPFPSSK